MSVTVTYGRVAHGADGRGRPAFAVRAVPGIPDRVQVVVTDQAVEVRPEFSGDRA